MLPNFLIVGAEKAGTTTLATILNEHPEVFICEPKEPRFFTHHNWSKGLGWYESLFDGALDYKAIGEASPAYTWAPESIQTPQRIHQCLGDIKYIYIVRNPVERTISHYRHALFHRWIPADTPIEKAFEMHPGLKNCSRYHYQIKQYLRFTRPEQWHTVVLEELVDDYEEIVKGIYGFLGITDTSPIFLPRENISDEKRRPWLIFKLMAPLMPYLPGSAVRLGRKFVSKFGNTIERPNIATSTYCALIEEFRPDVVRFGEFCRKDLKTIWGISDS